MLNLTPHAIVVETDNGRITLSRPAQLLAYQHTQELSVLLTTVFPLLNEAMGMSTMFPLYRVNHS